MSRASLKRRARFLHARKQKGRIRIIQNALVPIERKPDGSLYRMTPAQQRDARKIIRRLCSNCVNDNCIRLDQGEEVTCPQMLSASVCCRFFRNVLLKDPEAGTLEAGFFSSGTKKHCAICGKEFYSAGNRAKYCADCKAGAQRKQQAEYARRRRAAIKENK
jgi:hypothetical protein